MTLEFDRLTRLTSHTIAALRAAGSITTVRAAGSIATLGAAGSLAALFAAGCSVGNSKPPPLAVHITHESVATSTPIVISGDLLAYLADEATSGPGGADYNHDGDIVDSVPVVVNMATAAETIIGVAANSIAFLGSDLYIVVDEAKDNRDWNADGDKTDLVLLHLPPGTATPQFVDLVQPDPHPATPTPRMIAVGTNLFYVSGGPAPTNPETTAIHFISVAAPLTHTPITSDVMAGPLAKPTLIQEQEGMIFVGLNEADEALDLNGDTDMTDSFVLALLDATVTNTAVRNTKCAMANNTGPFRAVRIGTTDWRVGFLVNEAAQGNTNLNDPALFSGTWQPTQCAGHADTDTLDNVLFFISFANWVLDPVSNPPRNTGLVGEKSIAIANGFIATISLESDEGTCDLNGDGDTTDAVVRMTPLVGGTQATNPILPITDTPHIRALFDAPGGTHGLAELTQGSSRVFAIVVHQADDDPTVNWGGQNTFDLVGWLLPTTTSLAPWDFTHGTGNNTHVGASWVGEQLDRSRLDVAFEEAVGGVSINTGGDNDAVDSVPTFAAFNGSNMVFPGVGVAIDAANAGIVASNNFGFFRIDEAADNRDWNGDGDKTDIVLMRVSFTQSTTVVMGTLVPGLARPAIETNFEGAQNGGAFIFNEATFGAGGTDVNGEGSKHPFVAWFHF